MFSLINACSVSMMSSVYLVASTAQNFTKINISTWIVIIVIILSLIFIIIGIYYPRLYKRFTQSISSTIRILKIMVVGTSVGKATNNYELGKAIETGGYSYDSKQDIFYSSMGAWQRNVGYCRMYDEASVLSGMIIDCEPIYFEYDKRKWLIEFWKGQYDLCTGCEIGVYTAARPDLNIDGVFNGTFYNCVNNSDRLQMELSLKKNGKTLFTRKDMHWWLTGFKLGVFSEPAELTIDLSITLKDEIMLNAFLKGLKMVGYLDNEIIINGNTVGLTFNQPHSPQPNSRTIETDRVIQEKNKLLCDRYMDITKASDNLSDKIGAIQRQAPDIYEKIIKVGINKNLFIYYEKIKNYLR